MNTETATYAYRVVRWVRQEYLVESETPLEKKEHIWGQLRHPNVETIEREVIQQVRP